MSTEKFDSSFFSGNRERLRQLFTGTAPIVLTAHGLMQLSGDEAYPFHQDRNFWYLTGVDEPGVILVMDKGKEYLVVPEREAIRERFDGSVDKEEMARISGIPAILGAKEGWKQLEAKLRRVQHVATLGASPAYVDFLEMYTNPARADLIRRIKEINPHIELLDLRAHLTKMRTVKQDAEIAAIQHAIDITVDTIKDVSRPKRLEKYAFEYEIEADITKGFRSRGGDGLGHAFAPVVASGVRACTLHYVDNSAPLASDELILLDVGAGADGYAADLTRTFSLGGHPSRRQQDVYEAVADAQDYALTLLKPGVLLGDYEKQMEEYMGEKLRALQLIKTISHDDVRRYYPHAATHFLGLDTHDAGDYDLPLLPGTVLTVEPGIYIPQEEIGVRLEDDVVITADGVRVLSSRLPKQLA